MTDDQTWALRGRAQLLHRPETGGVAAADVGRFLGIPATPGVAID